MQLETERLRLRRWKRSDIEPYSKLCADPEVMKWIGSGSVRSHADCARAIKEFEANWKAKGFGLFAVELKRNGQFVGFCGLSIPHFLPQVMPAVEIGWRLAREYWGRGLATEAARAVLDFGFRDVELDEVVSICQIGNDASEHIMRKIGMDLDGRTTDPTCGRPVVVYRVRKGSALV